MKGVCVIIMYEKETTIEVFGEYLYTADQYADFRKKWWVFFHFRENRECTVNQLIFSYDGGVY